MRQFCLNVLDLYPKKLKMAKEAITHIHHLDYSETTETTEVDEMKIDANFLILQLLFTPIEKNQEMLNDIAQIIKEEPNPSKSSKFPIVAKLLPTLSIILTEESKSIKIIKRLYEKVSQSVDAEDLCKFSQVLIESEHHRNETLFTLAILLFKDKITKAEKKNSEETDKIVLQYVKLILAATKWIPIKATNKENRNDDDDGAKLLTFAHELKAIPSMAMKVAIQSLCNNRSEDCQRHNLLVAMIGGVWHNKSVDPSLVETVTNFLKNQPEFSSALLASTSSLEIFSHFGIGTVQL